MSNFDYLAPFRRNGNTDENCVTLKNKYFSIM